MKKLILLAAVALLMMPASVTSAMAAARASPGDMTLAATVIVVPMTPVTIFTANRNRIENEIGANLNCGRSIFLSGENLTFTLDGSMVQTTSASPLYLSPVALHSTVGSNLATIEQRHDAYNTLNRLTNTRMMQESILTGSDVVIIGVILRL